MLNTGFSADSASWKIIAIWLARTLRRSFSGSLSRSTPRYLTSPLVMKPGGLSRMPMIACAVTDLPQPDSPRIARVSPGARTKLAPLTARATPSWVRNSTCRSFTSSSGARGSRLGRTSICAWISVISGSPQLRVEGVAYRVAQHDEGQHRDRQEHRRPDQRCGCDAHVGA